MTIWRGTENRAAATGKPGALTWATNATGVKCYLQIGESVKDAHGFVLDEADNLFTIDQLHCEDTVSVLEKDVVKLTASTPNSSLVGQFWVVRGDQKIRNRRANKQSVRVSRLATTQVPNGVS